MCLEGPCHAHAIRCVPRLNSSVRSHAKQLAFPFSSTPSSPPQSESRQKEAEAHKRLQVELRRVHALERMRLQDIGEIQDVGRRAHALQQEVWALRDAAAAERARGGEAATPRGAPYPAVAMQ